MMNYVNKAMKMLRTCEELLLDSDGIGNNVLHCIGIRTTLKVAERHACEAGVHDLVTTDDLVGERQARHHTVILGPEDSATSVPSPRQYIIAPGS